MVTHARQRSKIRILSEVEVNQESGNFCLKSVISQLAEFNGNPSNVSIKVRSVVLMWRLNGYGIEKGNAGWV
jgi:hypothetical protein